MPDIPGTIDYLTLLMNAIISGRIEAKTIRDMSPEQRAEYKARLIAEEKAAIEAGYAMHDTNPQPLDARDDTVDRPDPKPPREGGGKGNPV